MAVDCGRVGSRAPGCDASVMRRYIHGWMYFFHVLWMQLRKKHGRGPGGWRQMLYIARCGRFIAAQQHRPELNPARRRLHERSY